MTLKSTRIYGVMGTKFSGKMARPRQMIGRDIPPPPPESQGCILAMNSKVPLSIDTDNTKVDKRKGVNGNFFTCKILNSENWKSAKIGHGHFQRLETSSCQALVHAYVHRMEP